MTRREIDIGDLRLWLKNFTVKGTDWIAPSTLVQLFSRLSDLFGACFSSPHLTRKSSIEFTCVGLASITRHGANIRFQNNEICDSSWQLKCLRVWAMAKSEAEIEVIRVQCYNRERNLIEKKCCLTEYWVFLIYKTLEGKGGRHMRFILLPQMSTARPTIFHGGSTNFEDKPLHFWDIRLQRWGKMSSFLCQPW